MKNESYLAQWRPTVSDFIPGLVSAVLTAGATAMLIYRSVSHLPAEVVGPYLLFTIALGFCSVVLIYRPLFGAGRSVSSYRRWKAWCKANGRAPFEPVRG